MRTIERTVSPEKAISTVRKEITKLGLAYRVERLGTGPSTYRCYLSENQHGEVIVGNGKGRGRQSLASAMFESLEHLFSSVRRHRNEIRHNTVAELVLNTPLQRERVLDMLYRNSPEAQIPCQTYESLTGTDSIDYPVFLVDPAYPKEPHAEDSFDYTNYGKYSTNNGSAIGFGKTEALIHAICELLERDALGCFLIGTFLSKQQTPVRLIAKDTLPENLQALIAKVEKMVKSQLTLIDITSDFGVPSCLAVIRNGKYILPHVGTGTSLSRAYAVERSVLEALQCFHLHTEDLEKADERAVRKFASLKRYQSCVTLDFSKSYAATGSYDDLPVINIPEGPLELYLERLLQIVSEHGYSTYHVIRSELASGITCVHCVIPGLERFHLVRNGLEVVPSFRGMCLLESNGDRSKTPMGGARVGSHSHSHLRGAP